VFASPREAIQTLLSFNHRQFPHNREHEAMRQASPSGGLAFNREDDDEGIDSCFAIIALAPMALATRSLEGSTVTLDGPWIYVEGDSLQEHNLVHDQKSILIQAS